MGPGSPGAVEGGQARRQGDLAGVASSFFERARLYRHGEGGGDYLLGHGARGADGDRDTVFAGADPTSAGGTDAGAGGSGILVRGHQRTTGRGDQQWVAEVHQSSRRRAGGGPLRRRAGRSVLRSASGKRVSQKI